ncbi:MAG: hypothetical protein C4317_02385 [Acidimicrobiia bacterium]
MTEIGSAQQPPRDIKRIVYSVVMIAALVLWSLGVLAPRDTDDGQVVRISAVLEDGIPVTLYIPRGSSVHEAGGIGGVSDRIFPLVVMAHGLVGDRVGLSYLAESLARNGYAVATYDAPGHGQNENSFGSPAGPTHRATMGRVIDWASSNKYVDASRIVVAGHSMGAATALDFASADPHPSAVLAISGGRALTGPQRPKNTMFIYAAGDPRVLKERVRQIAADLAGVGAMREDVVYGNVEKGDAVAQVEVRGVDHLSIVSSPQTVRWLVAWLRETVGRGGETNALWGPRDTLSPADDAVLAQAGARHSYLPLVALALILAYGAGRVTGRLQRGTDWIALDENLRWGRIVVLWGAALLAGLIVTKVFGLNGAIPLGLLSGLIVLFATSGATVAAAVSFLKDTVAVSSPRPRGILSAAAGSALLLVLLAGGLSKIHNLGLDPKRLLSAVLSAAGFFPGFWAVEFLSKRGGILRSITCSVVLKLMALGAIGVAIGIGALQPVMVLAIPLLVGVLVYFEVFAVGAYKSGASPAVVSFAEAVALGWIAAALGPLQF